MHVHVGVQKTHSYLVTKKKSKDFISRVSNLWMYRCTYMLSDQINFSVKSVTVILVCCSF